MFVSFDSDGSEVIRDMASVGIRLERHVKSGLLRMISARTITGSAETYLARIKALAKDHRMRCLVIDPVSTLAKAGNELTANGEMASQATRDSLLSIGTPSRTPGSTSTTWCRPGRNRGLSIIKSRGTAHSNQVRELILSDTGVTLADTYTAGGEVLMGTLRWQKEGAERVATKVSEVAAKLKRVRLAPRKPSSRYG